MSGLTAVFAALIGSAGGAEGSSASGSISGSVDSTTMVAVGDELDITIGPDGKAVLTAEWGPAVSKNPFMQFTVKGAKAGDKIAITWKDNHGDTRTDEATVS